MKPKPKQPKPLDYTAPDGHPYKVELPGKLFEDFDLGEKDLPLWHDLFTTLPKAQWQFVRMLYGINPVLPRLDGDTDVIRLFTRTEIMADRGWKKKEFAEYLQALVEGWLTNSRPKLPRIQPATPPPPVEPPAPVAAEIPPPAEDDRTTIQSFGFSPAVFDLEDRDDIQKASEIRWFAARLRELAKMFQEPMATGLARQAIINEMLLRRCDDEMTRLSPRNRAFGEIQTTKIEIEKVYQDQWEQLEKICPFIKALSNKVSFSASLSDVIEGYKQYRANGRNDLIDGLHNYYGMQVLMRANVLEPAPKYRPGWVLACLEAKEGLFDPNFKRRIPQHLLAALDNGLAAAHAQLVEEGKIKLTDLELEGPAGEYPALVDQEIIIPEEPVKLE